MAKHKPYQAYVVYRGKIPGVYHSWADCQAQTDGYAKNKYLGYNTVYEAENAWVEWQRKLSVKVGASSLLQQQKSAHKPSPFNKSPSSLPQHHAPQQIPGPLYPILPTIEEQISVSRLQPPYITEPAPSRIPGAFENSSSAPSQPRSQPLYPALPTIDRAASQTPTYYALQSSSPPSHPLKRSSSHTRDGESDMQNKRAKMEGTMDLAGPPIPAPLTREERQVLADLDRERPKKQIVEEIPVVLSPEQERVVNLALRKNNIFLTGAAGSGKTVTLKEILKRIRKRRKGGKVEVVAPTGIAALPLGGRTTYSLSGFNPDSFREGITELLKKKKQTTIKLIQDLDVLVVEEISMVENDFLERMNRLFQSVMDNTLPFGGKQVIFLGDFHQLPPVKPFDRCIECGHQIAQNAKAPHCPDAKCYAREKSAINAGKAPLQWGDKWAFKSKVWQDLNLRHIRLEQIHRQKDTRFQDILNKIRHGEILSLKEWHDLERPKEIPKNSFAVRLMSRLAQVKAFNNAKLEELKSQTRSWTANDTAEKMFKSHEGREYPAEPHKVQEHLRSLNDHRFPAQLTLKVGARVVLLQNLDHKKGLVNGSQGVVIGFAPAPAELEMLQDMNSSHSEARQLAIMNFQQRNAASPMRPLVRFANGVTELIVAFAQSSLRGEVREPWKQYVVTRTQVPLALAWALSIHKSQGMTLDYVEVSSRDIFESGQLYVALSRATHLDPGLRLTGFKRDQLPMDPDVLKFYNETKWEKLDSRTKDPVVIDLT